MAEKKDELEWIKIKPAEMEKIIIDLAKKGETPAKIGLILRDKHGIPKAKLLGRGITEILKDAKIDYNDEEDVTKGRIENIKKHLEIHKHDFGAKKSLTKALWNMHDFGVQAEQAQEIKS